MTTIFTVTSDLRLGHLTYPVSDERDHRGEALEAVLATAQFLGCISGTTYVVRKIVGSVRQHQDILGECADNFTALLEFCTAELGGEPSVILAM